MPVKAQLLQQWESMACSVGLKTPNEIGLRLAARYSEPHRRFHTLDHLWHVLHLLRPATTDGRLVLAAWYHDAIYDPVRTDNESRSAELARAELVAAGLDPVTCKFVEDAVLATASHRALRPEFAPLLDADMSILGASPENYVGYVAAVREEYGRFSDSQFRAGRCGFIGDLLSRHAIFATTHFKERFERQARVNLTNELTAYNSEGRAAS